MPICSVCKRVVKESCNSILCDICDSWINQHEMNARVSTLFNLNCLRNMVIWLRNNAWSRFTLIALAQTLPSLFMLKIKLKFPLATNWIEIYSIFSQILTKPADIPVCGLFKVVQNLWECFGFLSEHIFGVLKYIIVRKPQINQTCLGLFEPCPGSC